MFGYCKFINLLENDCFKSKRFYGEVFKVAAFGKNGVLMATSKVGGTRYFRPDDTVKRISRKAYDKFIPADPLWNAMQKGKAQSVK